MKNIFLGICIVMTSFFSWGQIDRSIVPEPGPAPEINIPKPTIFKLDNGMTVILSENHKTPKVSINLVMGSDPRVEGDKTGLSEVMGNLVLSGTSNRTKDEIDLEKDFIGASLYASSSSVYLSVLTKHLDKGLDLMTDVVKNANFPQSEFDRIVKQQESGLFASESNPNAMSQNAMYKTLFGNNHPYGEVMTTTTLKNITRDDVIDLYKKQYTPAGSYLVIVGDISKEDAKTLAETRFGTWEGLPPYEASYNPGITPMGNQVVFVEKKGAVQSVINIAFPIEMKPGNPNQIKLTVLNKVFGGGGFGTRLMQNLREDKAYTYGAYSSLDIDRDGSYLTASGSFRNEVTDSAITQFLYEFDRITKDEVTQDELSLNKASLSGSFARSLESPRTIANFALSTLRNELPEDYYQTYLQKLNQVNQADLLSIAQQYFKPHQLYIIVVGNKDVLENIQKFDSDGEVTILDAFGNPATAVEYEKSDLSLTEIFENYLMEVTTSSSMKKAKKALKKLKTVTTTSSISPMQAPVEFTLTQYYEAPNKSATKMVFNGMVLQEDIFNGKDGITKAMSQTGAPETKKYTEEEIANKLKLASYFEEYSLLNHLDDIQLLGITEKEGHKYYVVSYTFGKTTTTNYYQTDNFQKTYSEKLEVTENGPVSATTVYGDFQETKGYIFPHSIDQKVAAISLKGTVKEILINNKIDEKVFNIE